MDSDVKQYEKMTQTPIHKLITSLAIPTIISMLITGFYNAADTFFVSQIGTSASAATGIVFSLMTLIQAVSFCIGMGSGTTISRRLGQKRNEEADIIGSSGLLFGISFGLLLVVFGNVFIEPLLKILGSTDTILPYAKDYAKYILIASPFMAGSFILNNMLRSEGKAKLSMLGILSGSILNIFLDPLLIFVFKMSISGAAIATGVSQFISFSILFSFYLRKKTVVNLSIKNFSKNIFTYLMILRNGLPSFCRQGLASISTVALNLNAVSYGDEAVAAMSIVTKVFMLIFAVVIGYGQGYQPVVGYNFGAKRFDRVKSAFKFTLKVGTILLTVLAVVGFIFSPTIIKSFINERKVIEIGTHALRFQCLAMPFMTIGVMANMTFQCVGKPWMSTFLSSCRQGIYFLPLILILPRIFGITGVEITQPIADALTCLTSGPFILSFIKKLPIDEAN